LQVSRYPPSELHGAFGEPFELLDSSVEQHSTPWGSPQQFVYCFCRRATSSFRTLEARFRPFKFHPTRHQPQPPTWLAGSQGHRWRLRRQFAGENPRMCDSGSPPADSEVRTAGWCLIREASSPQPSSELKGAAGHRCAAANAASIAGDCPEWVAMEVSPQGVVCVCVCVCVCESSSVDSGSSRCPGAPRPAAAVAQSLKQGLRDLPAPAVPAVP
jgi:hypothetical protein